MPGHNAEMLALRTSKAWGYKQDEWRAAIPDDRERMMGYDMFVARVEAFLAEWHEDKRKGKTGSEGESEYDRLKKRLKI